MRRKKLPGLHGKNLKYATAGVLVVIVATFFFLTKDNTTVQKTELLSPPAKRSVGYKEEDRKQMEQLIHEGTKND